MTQMLIETETCDRCCARACVTFVLRDNKGVLSFCGHHSNEVFPKLVQQAHYIRRHPEV